MGGFGRQSRTLAALHQETSGESRLNDPKGFENRQLKAGLGMVQSDLAGCVESAEKTLGCATSVRSHFTGLTDDIGKITEALDDLASLATQAEGLVQIMSARATEISSIQALIQGMQQSVQWWVAIQFY